MYGIDDEMNMTEENDYTVRIPQTGIQLSEQNMASLRQRIDPLSDSDNFGIELYIQTLDFLRTFLSQD